MKNLSFHVVFMQYLEIISEHNQIDKILRNKEIGSPISGFYGLTPLYN